MVGSGQELHVYLLEAGLVGGKVFGPPAGTLMVDEFGYCLYFSGGPSRRAPLSLVLVEGLWMWVWVVHAVSCRKVPSRGLEFVSLFRAFHTCWYFCVGLVLLWWRSLLPAVVFVPRLPVLFVPPRTPPLRVLLLLLLVPLVLPLASPSPRVPAPGLLRLASVPAA